MHMKNIHKDILEKNDADLAQFVAEKRSELQKLRFGVAGSGCATHMQFETPAGRSRSHSLN
jgi:ribosomal protein L29